MDKIVLGLDLDGVLYDFHSAMFTYFQYEMKYTGTYQEFWLEYFRGLSKEKQKYYLALPIFYDAVIPSCRIMSFLEYAKDRAEIYYITHRPMEVESITKRHLKKYNFPYQDNLCITDDKVTACRMYGVTHFLDDFANQVEAVAKITNAYLFAKPWNKEYRDKLTTVYSLEEFRQLVFENNMGDKNELVT